jgi:hypothetical protein
VIALLLAALPLLLDENAAAARLAELRSGFVGRPKAQSMAALATLADEAPDTAAAARALDWLGDLRRGDGDRDGARAAYARAYRSRDRQGRCLAARGLADLLVEDGQYVRGLALYREARAYADGILALELDQKIEAAKKQHRRALGGWAAWALVGGALAYFLALARVWRRPWLGVPTEALFVAPLYALIVAGCVGRDPGVLHALWLCALWSFALIVAAGLAARRRAPSPGAKLAHAALLAVANLALFYAVLNHAGILESLFFSVVE